jgi:hypothetical protein
MQNMRCHAPRGLQMPDVVTLEIEGMGDHHEMDSGADPEDDDNGKDAALLLSAPEIIDHSCCSRRYTAGMDHHGLARTAQQARRT